MKVPIHLAMAAISATLFDADDAPMLLDVSTDTRTIQPGDTFLALHGENYNGHDYCAEAIAKGAAMSIVDQPESRIKGHATMVVMRTQWSYMALAGVARDLFKGRVIAITGSAGKTTTKAFLTQLLATRYGTRVLAAPGNENNEIGVSKLFLNSSNEDYDAIVVEMGARQPNDIATLVTIAKPDVGILTNVGEAHLEIMGSREKLADAKWALFGRGARAVLNAGDEVSKARASDLPQPPHWFDILDAGAPLPTDRRGTYLQGSQLIDVDGDTVRRLEVSLAVPGTHNRVNALAAVAGALELDADFDAIAAALAHLHLPEGRFESFAVPGDWRIIYDAYNANASGTIAALDALAQEKPARAIALLGSMAELGDESEALHERVGAHAAKRTDVLLVGGEHADALARGAAGGGMDARAIVTVPTNADAVKWLREHARAGDAVLLKGSRKYKLEEILEEFRS
jgi:UDP-N-acetylmuramoyl-tripeptide--D-alanyl-D-alanine ligase